MSAFVSSCGASWAALPLSAELERRTKSLRLSSTCVTSSVPETWWVFTPATVSSPSSLASPSQLRGSSPSAASDERRLPPRARELAVGAGDLGGGLLVVDVLELHERAVAGGQEAGLDHLAGAVGAELEVEVDLRQLALVGAEGAAGADADRVLELVAALELELGVQLQVGAVDRAAEGLVEQALDVLLVVSATAGAEQERGQQQQKQEATHAAQGIYPTATFPHPPG